MFPHITRIALIDFLFPIEVGMHDELSANGSKVWMKLLDERIKFFLSIRFTLFQLFLLDSPARFVSSSAELEYASASRLR